MGLNCISSRSLPILLLFVHDSVLYLQVTVFVIDVNDCPPTFLNPEFSNPNYSLPVQESTPVRSSLLRLTTTDCDYYSNYTTIHYQLQGNGSGTVINL